ncbi:hypothetical protein ABPG75_012159 [Micractinium tetrahymenae]
MPMGFTMSRLGTVLAALAALAVVSAADVLVLRRDWTPTSCSQGGCKNDYPDSFSIDALYLSSGADPTPRTSCGGKGGLRAADLAAAGLARQQLGCAWQNYDPGLRDIQEAWTDSWDVYGKCTASQTAAGYLRLGLQLDRRYPLPNHLPATVGGTQLQVAVQAAFGQRPIVGCGNGQLRNIQICFDPATLQPVNCPWNEPVACTGQLAVPRTGRGISAACTSYYQASPVGAFLQGPTASQPPPPSPSPPPTASPPPPSPSPPPPSPSPPPPSPSPPPPSPSPPPPSPSPIPPPPRGKAPSKRGLPPPLARDVPPTAAPAPAETPPPVVQPAQGVPPEGPAGGDAAPAPSGNEVLDPQGSSSGSSSSSGSGSSSSMAAALGGGIVGGLLVGLAVFGGGYYLYRRGMRAGQASVGLLGSRSASGSGNDGGASSTHVDKGLDGNLAAAEAGGTGGGQAAAAAQGEQPAAPPLVYYGRLPAHSLPTVLE